MRLDALSLLTISIVSFGCSDPFLLMPGKRLEGRVVSPPVDWSFVGEDGMAELETLPEDPYSVNLAFTVLGGVLYVNAGDTETQWVQNMNVDPRVRLRIDGNVYELRAERVTDTAEVATFGEVWTAQSMFRRDPRDLDEVWIYRLVAR